MAANYASNELQVSISVLLRLENDLTLFTDGRHIPDDTLDSMIVSFEFVYRELLAFQATSHVEQAQEEAIEFVRNCLRISRSISEQRMISHHPTSPLAIPVSYQGCVGRPSYDIPYEQLQYLIESKFSVPMIADMLGVSVRTVRRRMDEYGLAIRDQYSALNDLELDELIQSYQTQFPMFGNRQMQGLLLSNGYRIQQSRIRESQRRIDPSGAIIRRLNVLNRREYRVPAPLSLYHIDGHHKLIR